MSAIILLAEVVDFQRFRRPREFMAYLGLVPSEYSPGETQHRGALTQAGNSRAAAGPSRSRLALSASADNRPRAGEPQPGANPTRSSARVAGATALAPSLSSSRWPRTSERQWRGGNRARTGRLHL